MPDVEYEYGKIFVNAEFELVREFLGTILDEVKDPKTWVRDGVEVEVRRNPDRGAAEDFIGWSTFVEIVPESEDTSNDQVLRVAQHVARRMSREFGQTVTAADYEELI